MNNKHLNNLLNESAARHSHLCPRQILGVRMGLFGLRSLGFQYPPDDKSLLVLSETDGCFVDGLEVACRVSVGQRTLRVMDMGKVAAVFAHVIEQHAIRLAPKPGVRQSVNDYVKQTESYQAQLMGYQVMPDTELFCIKSVVLKPSIETLVSRPGIRTMCVHCEEEIINEREIYQNGKAFCRSCAGEKYYIEN